MWAGSAKSPSTDAEPAPCILYTAACHLPTLWANFHSGLNTRAILRGWACFLTRSLGRRMFRVQIALQERAGLALERPLSIRGMRSSDVLFLAGDERIQTVRVPGTDIVGFPLGR